MTQVEGGSGPSATALQLGPDPAMAAAAKYLTRRARSEAEVRSHLAAKGFDEDEVDACARRLHELNLIDDVDFAREWVSERSGRKGLAGAALVAELVEKGVAREVAEAAVAEAGLDELSRAVELVHQHMQRLHHLPTRDQARRLLAVLGRRGYPQEVSFDAVKRVLPPEGWD